MKRLMISTAALALMATSAIAADMVEIVDVPEAVVGYSWSGLYIGAHIGAVWQHNDVDTGCSAFRDLVGEGGGAPTYDSAADITQIDDDDFFSGPSDNQGRDPGCFNATVDESDSPTGDAFGDREFPGFNLDGDYVALTDGFDGGDDNDVSFLGGAQLGINQQYGRLVVGLETDFSWLGGGDNDNGGTFEYFHRAHNQWDAPEAVHFTSYEGNGTVSIESGVDWLATFRGRAGAALGNEGRWLVYGTAGVAVAGVNNGISGSWDDDEGNSRDWCDDAGECQFSSDDDDNDYQVGYALGVGAEYAFTDNLSLGLEYLYVGFGDQDGNSITFNADSGRSFGFRSEGVDDVQLLRAKLNWKFKPQG